ncbi:ABC transporter substrate-binding protein [Streptomyces sp. NPDC052052]|uniref:ABC transporter substrate-binding protein n=1 Tax=Streptomyces sp. NPDC052052 TaxID=3154756 RepID=UPI003413DBFD
MMKFPSLALISCTAVLSLGLVGCSSSDDDASAEKSGTSVSKTRTVMDATGAKIKVPATPKRVVTLHYAAAQPVIDLGFTPVGQSAFNEASVPEEMVEKIESVPVVTTQDEPDLEKIANLDPDLILVPNTYEEEVVEQLKAVAAVYTFTLRGGDRAKWDQRTEEVADALGATEKVEELADAFGKRQKEISEKYADLAKENSVAVIGAFEENNFYAWGEKNMTGTILAPLGFTWSKQENDIVKKESEPEATLSNEKLTSAVGDADVLFIDSDLRGTVNSFMTDLQKTTLYKELPSVKNGHVYKIGKTTIAGYSDANYALDRIEEALEDLQK